MGETENLSFPWCPDFRTCPRAPQPIIFIFGDTRILHIIQYKSQIIKTYHFRKSIVFPENMKWKFGNTGSLKRSNFETKKPSNFEETKKLWNQEAVKPRNQGTKKPRNFETKKLWNQEILKPRNQETKTLRNQETLKPRNQLTKKQTTHTHTRNQETNKPRSLSPYPSTSALTWHMP